MTGQADWLKQRFDSAVKNVVAARHNGLAQALGDVGAAARIGAAPLLPGGAATVGGQLAYLKDELNGVAQALVHGDDLRADETLAKHADWAEELKTRHVFTAENAEDLLRQEVGTVFAQVLEHAGVFKCTPEGQEAFLRFIRSA